jgi:hypothetical protein
MVSTRTKSICVTARMAQSASDFLLCDSSRNIILSNLLCHRIRNNHEPAATSTLQEKRLIGARLLFQGRRNDKVMNGAGKQSNIIV